MKIRMKKNLIRVSAVAMVSALVAGAALIDNATGLAPLSAAAQNTSGLYDVSDRYNTQSIRSQYFNEDAVSVNQSVKNEERWVIVDLGGATLYDAFGEAGYAETFSEYVNTTAAHNLQAQIERSHRAFLNRLTAKGVAFQYKYSYSTLNNGVAIKVKNCDVAAVKAMGEVKNVYASESYAVPAVAVSNDAYAYSTGIYNSSAAAEKGFMGDGMVVAVLDTGLDYTHDAFKVQPTGDLGLTESGIKAVLEDLQSYQRNSSLTASDFYISDKIPYAYDYADDDVDVYPSYSSHGTHVAGIVAGRDDSQYVNDEQTETFVGVAPNAQLAIFKVFTDDLENDSIGGANAIDILAALADCATLGVDVINMSLGTTAGFSQEGFADADESLQGVYDKIEELGISLVTAASNDFSSGFGGSYGTNLTSNPDSGTVGSPSTYEGALSVASINGQEAHYFTINGNEDNVAFITESADANGKAYSFLDMLYEQKGLNKTDNPTYTMEYVLVGGVGGTANYTRAVRQALQRGNTIAVIERGDLSFAEKVQNAIAYGAAAVIIYNNVSGSIRMSLGEVNDPVPTCSISMDAGKLLKDNATNNLGQVTFSYDYAAGPFMSDFSSWGPTPDLKLKPEITAHGGEITSAVPGGYETMSGTSMATPNMAGAIALLRQYAQSEWTSLEGKEINDRVNQLLMSTAKMARNEEGNPYSPRKQGAGLADIANALNTKAYLTVEGNDKPKLELLDDPEKRGVYEMKFTVNSFADTDLVYTPNVYIMTESLSTDERTVAEKAYMLENCDVAITANGAAVAAGASVTVPANGTLEITVKITLDQTARNYLDKTFENGMYVEGFIRLSAEENGVDLGIPYLAFYGDWMKAPLFDYSVFEVEASEADKSVDEVDKLKASSNPSALIGLFDDEKYIVTLGSYLYSVSDNYTDILPSNEHAAISCFNTDGKRTVYQLYSFHAGLLRSAKTMDVHITDSASGETIYRHTETDVRKSYSAGGSNIGAHIRLAIDPITWNLSNNKKYTITLTGALDYNGAGTTERNSYSFDFTVDNEAPRVLDYRLRYEPYTESNGDVNYRIYLDADVYDNQYAMSMLPCYINEKDELTIITEYPIPIYSTKGGVTTVTYEVTDSFEEYILGNNFYLAVNDYAMNESVYLIDYALGTEYPQSIQLTTDDKLTLSPQQNSDYPVYNLKLGQYENYVLNVEGLPDGTGAPALVYEATGVVATHENQIFTAQSSGSGTVTVKNSEGDVLAQINVNAVPSDNPVPVVEKLVLSSMLDGMNYLVPLDGQISLRPNLSRQVQAHVEPWYSELVNPVELEYSTSNPRILTVTEDGVINTLATGFANVTVSIKGNDIVRTIIEANVEDELYIVNNQLRQYFGGKNAVIPDNKNVLSIHEDAFKDNTLIESIEFPISLTSIPENCFEGCINLKRVVIPAELMVINKYAFAGCTSLEEIVLKEAEDKFTHQPMHGTLTIGRGAFEGCVKLKTISNQLRITTAFDRAFADCSALEEINISGLRTGGSAVFAGCTSLKKVTMSALTHVGSHMFDGCTSLNNVTYYADAIPDYAFNGCSSLSSFTFTGTQIDYLGERAFADAAFTAFTLPDGSYEVGAFAFENCANLTTVSLSSNTTVTFGSSVFQGCASFTGFAGVPSANYKVVNGYLLNAAGTELILAPAASGAVNNIPAGVEKIGTGAFAGTQITSVNLNNVTELGAYAFANSSLQEIDLSHITVIPEGAFRDCVQLTRDGVTLSPDTSYIGAYAFADCLSYRPSINLPSLKEVGECAFRNTPVAGLVAPLLETIGDAAFYGHNLQARTAAISLPSVTSLGSYAFAKAPQSNNGANFFSIKLGPVKEMGEYVFADLSALESVEFAEGTEVVGAWAFVSSGTTLDSIGETGVVPENRSLKKVVVPATVKKIGEFAFLNAVNLVSSENGRTLIDLTNVTEIGMGAFWYCAKVTALNLESAETIGEYAFSNSGVTRADLQQAKNVGSYAFAFAPLTYLSVPRIEIIGAFAFAGTQITNVEIPATMKFTYRDSWIWYDDFNEPKHREGRYFYTYGAAAFGAIETLAEIKVEQGSESFFVDEDGVLYGITDDGSYVLLQYTAGNTSHQGGSYEVLDGTVRIGDGAFYFVQAVDEIVFPQTLREIGTQAFYGCYANRYVFNTVEAPVLEAGFDLPASTHEEFVALTYYYGIFYSNFYNYVSYVFILVNGELGRSLTAVRPENGLGYDTVIWNGFFVEQETNGYAPEQATIDAENAIKDLPALDELKAEIDGLSTDDEKLNRVIMWSAGAVSEARTLYGRITSDAQRALIADSLAKLVSIETYIRDMRAQLGDPVALSELRLTVINYKYYIGQSFNPSDVVVTAVYEDGSEVILTANDYSVSITRPLTADDTEIIITYGGLTCEPFYISVTEAPADDGNGGLDVATIVGISVGCAVVAAGAVVAVILAMKKRKNAQPADQSAENAEQPELNDGNANSADDTNHESDR